MQAAPPAEPRRHAEVPGGEGAHLGSADGHPAATNAPVARDGDDGGVRTSCGIRAETNLCALQRHVAAFLLLLRAASGGGDTAMLLLLLSAADAAALAGEDKTPHAPD